jgi:hypothetical protein
MEHYLQHRLLTEDASILNKKLEINFGMWTVVTTNLDQQHKFLDRQIELNQQNET